jgi:hypothetical protein
MTRTRIATAIAALAVAAASLTVVVPASFGHGNDGKPAGTSTSGVDPLPGTQDPESFDIGTPPTVEGDADLGGGDAPTAP